MFGGVLWDIQSFLKWKLYPLKVFWIQKTVPTVTKIQFVLDEVTNVTEYDPEKTEQASIYVTALTQSGEVAIEKMVASITAALVENSTKRTFVSPDQQAVMFAKSLSNIEEHSVNEDGESVEAIVARMANSFQGFYLEEDILANLLGLLKELIEVPSYNSPNLPKETKDILLHLLSYPSNDVVDESTDILTLVKVSD